MRTDDELLRRYAQDGEEAAFADLVRRHVDMVYSAAWRLVGGDAHLAQDVCQSVFLDLARKAGALTGRETLAGWLHTGVRFAAAKVRRGEGRRREREQEAYFMQNETTMPEIQWEEVQPMLDEAVGELGERDRDVVMLRFFQEKSHREVGEALGMSEEGARKRVDRALEKLRGFFAQRGVRASAAILAATITANSVKAAPEGLAGTLTGTALAGAGGGAVAGTIFKTLYVSAKAKMAVAAAAVVVAAVMLVAGMQKENTRLRAELANAPMARANGGVVQTAPGAATATPAGRAAALATILQANKSRADVTRDLLDYLATLSPADYPELLNTYGAMPRTELTALAKTILLSVWATSDPATAVAWVKGRANDTSRSDDYLAVFQSWAASNGAAALAGLNQVDEPAVRAGIQNTLLSWMSLRDPKGALAILQGLPLGRQTPESYAGIFYNWANQAPAEAATAVLNLPPSLSRRAAIEAVANAWAQQDAAAALAWARDLPAGSTRTDALGDALAALAKDNPALAASALSSLPNGAKRNEMINAIAKEWGARDATAALAWVKRVANGQVSDQAVEGIAARLSQRDPAKAAEFLAQVTDATVREVALPQLAGTWAQKDIPGALAWVQALPTTDGGARAAAYQNILQTWAQTDPVSAAAYVKANTGDPNYPALVSQVAKSWAAANPQAALAWVRELPAGGSQENALRAALINYAAADPKAAWDYAAALPQDEAGARSRLMSTVVESWSEQNPAQAAALLATIPVIGNNSGTSIATGVVAANWVRQDPEAASLWVDSLPDGGGRDRAVRQLIKVEGENDPAAAFKWVRTMRGGTGLRQNLLNEIVKEWAMRDPAAATAAVEAEFPEAGPRRSQLLGFVKQNAPNVAGEPGNTGENP